MRQPSILMYHWFRAEGAPSRSRSPQLEISPRLFRRQMRLLRGRGYRAVPLASAMRAAAARESSPRSVVLTFDDGTLDFWTCARPALDEAGFRATLFVVTGHVGGTSEWDRDLGEPPRPLLDWERILRLRDEGHEIGSHTDRHRVLTGLPDAEARGELERSREVLTERLGAPPFAVAYPRGFYDERHKAMAAEAGYRAGCAVALRWRDLATADPYALKRVTIKGTESLALFRLRILVSRWVRLRAPAALPADATARG